MSDGGRRTVIGLVALALVMAGVAWWWTGRSQISADERALCDVLDEPLEDGRWAEADVVLFLVPGTPEDDVEEVAAEVAGAEGVESVEVVSPEQAHEELLEHYADDPHIANVPPDALPASLRVSTRDGATFPTDVLDGGIGPLVEDVQRTPFPDGATRLALIEAVPDDLTKLVEHTEQLRPTVGVGPEELQDDLEAARRALGLVDDPDGPVPSGVEESVERIAAFHRNTCVGR